jgi:hypothetical protein
VRDVKRAWLVGAGEEPFRSVLRRVLRDLGFRLGTGSGNTPSPDLVLVEVERGHETLRLAAAQERARGAPVIAVLRTSDGELASHALATRAHAFHALDTPLAHLRETVLSLIELKSAQKGRTPNHPSRAISPKEHASRTSEQPSA